jgi:phosphoglycolate phosphatase
MMGSQPSNLNSLCAFRMTAHSLEGTLMLNGVTVVFDLDGTMIDTAPDLIHAANHTLEAHGVARVATRIIQPAVGYGARAMIRTAMESLSRTPTEDELTGMTDEFLAFYAENILVDSRAFPGLVPAMDELHVEGVLLAVCTNKREGLSKKLLAGLGLGGYFAFIAGRETFPVSKPDPGHVLATIRAAGGDARRAVMVGDSSADADAAKGAGVPFIAVSFGYGESPIDVLKPDAIIHSFAELVPAVRGLVGAEKQPA